MKKKLLTVALAAVMVVSTAINSFAATTYDDGLIGYYTFDDTLNNSVADGAAKLHGGAGDTWNADATGTAAYLTGKNGKAYSFAGDNGTVKGEGLELDVKTTSAYTISMWINSAEKKNFQPIVFTNIDGDNYVTAGMYYNDFASGGIVNYKKAWTWLDKNYEGCPATLQDIPTDTWVYVTLTVEADGTTTLYYNAEVLKSVEITGYTEGYFKDCPIFLGVNWWDNSFKGAMDDVAVYNKALSADEVKALYAKGGVPTTTTNETPTPGGQDPVDPVPTGDATMVGLLLAVAAVSAVVVLKKKTVTE